MPCWRKVNERSLITNVHIPIPFLAEAAVSECVITGVDMIFVMDQSGSIGSENFELMKQLAINITDEFDIGPNDTQVGWISFNNAPTVMFHLSTYKDKESLHEAINNITYSGGGTNIDEALLAINNTFVESAGARRSYLVPEVAIVVTDGRSHLLATQRAADFVRETENVDVFAVGVGDNVDVKQLEAVASAGVTNDNSHVFQISGFVQNELTMLQETIRRRACFGKS